MFTIKSYIQHPKRPIKDFVKVNKDPLYYFIDIDNTKEILSIKKNLDLYYIYGVLYMCYNNQTIINFTNYDLIDHLWAYLLNMTEEFLQSKKSEMYFPDQPLPMSMKNSSDNYILFSINYVQWKLPKYEFLSTLIHHAKIFFEKMILLIEEKSNIYQKQLQKIKFLELKIKFLKK